MMQHGLDKKSEELKSEILDASNKAISNITEFVSKLSKIKRQSEKLNEEFNFLDKSLLKASEQDQKLKDENYRKALIYYIKGYTLYKLQKLGINKKLGINIGDEIYKDLIVTFSEKDGKPIPNIDYTPEYLLQRNASIHGLQHIEAATDEGKPVKLTLKKNTIEELLKSEDFQKYAKTYTDRIDGMFDNTQFCEAIKSMNNQKDEKENMLFIAAIVFGLLFLISGLIPLIGLAAPTIAMQTLFIAMGATMSISFFGGMTVDLAGSCMLEDLKKNICNIANQAKLEILAGSLADEIAISNEISAIQNSLTKKINEYGNKNDIDTKNIPENMKIVLKSLWEDKSKNSGDAQKTDNNIGEALINLIQNDYKGDSIKAINDIVKQLDLKTEDGKAAPKKDIEDIRQSLNKILHLEMIRMGKKGHNNAPNKPKITNLKGI